MPTSVIGRAYAEDADDGDYKDKTYSTVSGSSNHHFAVSSDGLISIRQGTPENEYKLFVFTDYFILFV